MKSSSDEIAHLRAQLEDLKAKARPEGPDTAQKGMADGRSDNQKLSDPTTPIKEIMEIRGRQKREDGW